jgi:hypothetical protein
MKRFGITAQNDSTLRSVKESFSGSPVVTEQEKPTTIGLLTSVLIPGARSVRVYDSISTVTRLNAKIQVCK